MSLLLHIAAPRLYIPVTTKYVFDYRERSYYQDPKWNAYFFTLKNEISGRCFGDVSFDCNSFIYAGVFPQPSLHSNHIMTRSHSGGYRDEAAAKEATDTGRKLILHYHNLTLDLADNESFPFTLTKGLRLISWYMDCVYYDNDYCLLATKHFVLDPYWELMAIYGKYTNEILDLYMISDELKATLYKSKGSFVCIEL